MARHYTEQERAEALAALEANSGNVRRTARQLGIGEKNIRNWRGEKDAHKKAAVEARLPQARASITDRLDGLIHALLDAMPSKLEEAPLREVATALGIAVDKKQLLSGQPTQIHADNLTDAERATRVASILDAARERRTNSTPPN